MKREELIKKELEEFETLRNYTCDIVTKIGIMRYNFDKECLRLIHLLSTPDKTRSNQQKILDKKTIIYLSELMNILKTPRFELKEDALNFSELAENRRCWLKKTEKNVKGKLKVMLIISGLFFIFLSMEYPTYHILFELLCIMCWFVCLLLIMYEGFKYLFKFKDQTILKKYGVKG